jgi:tetratricopeptide (TPR) repeat protein
LIENLKLLVRLYSQPAAAMGAILDRGSLLFASLAVLVISILLPFDFRFYTPLLVLALIYVPGLLLLGKLLARLGGGMGAVFQRDYSPLLTCTAMAWAAANLPVLVVRWILPLRTRQDLIVLEAIAGLSLLWFLALTFFAVRTVFGTESVRAVSIVGLSWLPLLAAVYLWGPLRFALGWLASPFFLFFAWYYLGGEIGNLGAGLRRRQSFHRMLEAAAVNPHDAEAQYQLGLFYQNRRQYTEAVQRFRNAIAIRSSETDAHFQLGRIARAQGRLKEALEHFQTVLDQDEMHHQHEILRELGALYLEAGQPADAWHELSTYVERRPYDPEGLYYAGQALDRLGRQAEAREMYGRAVESARTAPRYLRGAVARWSRLAAKELGR